MSDIAIQFGIAAFGLTALWMAMGNHTAQRKWAPIIGLVGQAFWIAFAWKAQAFGIAVLTAAYTAVYLRGAWVQFRAAGPSSAPPEGQQQRSEPPVEPVREDGTNG